MWTPRRSVCVCVCVCVCQTLFLRDSFFKQGVQAAHPVLHQRRHWMRAGDIDLGRQIDVPAEFFTRCYSTLPRFDSMVLA